MADAVTHWNDVLLEVIRDVGGSPCPIARGGAMMHGAVYDAVNSIVPTHEEYLVKVPASPTASIDVAVAYAARDTLAAAFPSTTVDLVMELNKTLGMLPPGTTAAEKAAGKAVGLAAAQAMIAARTNDGADDNTAYVNGTKPGDWRPTEPLPDGQAASPNWPKVTPFTMTSGSQFRPPRPGGFLSKTQMLASPEYAEQLNDVKKLGRFDATTTKNRTPEQERIAFFWANDVDGKYKPPGQLFDITRIVSELRDLDVVENARLFALVALAMGDAAIVAWDAKYSTDLDLWRPETAIKLANTATNPNTSPDSAWAPLSVRTKNSASFRFSPPFPAYVSGHATFGAAHAAIMRRYFGTDNVTFTAQTEDPNATNMTRTFNSFTAVALENARSRVYLGVHYQWDADHGFLSGNALGDYVFANRLQPL
ncbi:MAG: vanadium-dependent haloperoxidase [Egibacteraceae bacterium]